MTDLLARLESAVEGSRELSDECLLAVGWRDGGKHLGQWVRPDGTRYYKSDAPDPSQNVQDAIDWMVPKGADYEITILGTQDEETFTCASIRWWDHPRKNNEGSWKLRSGNKLSPALALCIAALKTMEVMND